MLYPRLLAGLLWLYTSVAAAKSLTGERVLIVAEDPLIEGDYSQFLGDLEARGFVLDIKSPRAKDLALFTHGVRSYDHAVLFPPTSKTYGNIITPQSIVEFVNKEGNVLLLTSPSSTPDSVRDLAAELNIDLPPRDHVAVDHFNHDTLSENPNHNLILVPRPTQSSKTQNYFGSSSNPIAFRGAGHSIGNRPLLFPVLSGSRTAYTYDTKKEKEFLDDAWAAGTQMQYITAFQARNNARIAISGSVEMFSDEFYTMTVKGVNGEETQTGNKDFAKDLTKWTFKETGVVKTVAIRHHLAGNASEVEINPMVYRIKNDVSFEIELSEWAVDHWKPFTVPPADSLQLEFTMLDPYYRVPLVETKTTEESTVYSTTFCAPDQHGVFAFTVNYKRPFVTYVEEKYTVTVRHFAHDEYTRSWDISGAWVWIGGIGVTVSAWIVFCGLWLYSAPTEKSTKKTQ